MASFTDTNFRHSFSIPQYTSLLESGVNDSKAYFIVDINIIIWEWDASFLFSIWDAVPQIRAPVTVNVLVIWKLIFKMLCWNPCLWLIIKKYIWNDLSFISQNNKEMVVGKWSDMQSFTRDCSIHIASIACGTKFGSRAYQSRPITPF